MVDYGGGTSQKPGHRPSHRMHQPRSHDDTQYHTSQQEAHHANHSERVLARIYDRHANYSITEVTIMLGCRGVAIERRVTWSLAKHAETAYGMTMPLCHNCEQQRGPHGKRRGHWHASNNHATHTHTEWGANMRRHGATAQWRSLKLSNAHDAWRAEANRRKP